ncbi:GAF domain-containing protein [Spiribacter sp. 2438]|uniref:sigma-54-dependent Fis family transcriptional regulator n=1 Tax=Spiribacter sp. 2438 TaxID=2666185 RepID=UPI0012B0DC1E|nr:sigma-54-dependent Fis family transcriptional regulator [Spiribacter sp. 2438]QGM21379.1 GAF domain-containing protein [Spiribacter sp. 2438]
MGRRDSVERPAGQIRGQLLDGAESPAGAAEGVGRSWQRSRENGLTPERSAADAMLEQAALALVRERNQRLIAFALPELENLRHQIAGTNSAVLLADANGVILERHGDPAFSRRSQRVALQPGACWGESARGTNAIGLALAEQRSASVHGEEHFLACNTFLTCAATPIRDVNGQLTGLLDVSGDQPARQLHALGLVRMGARMIENRMLETEFPDAIYLHFHVRPELVGTLGEGIVAVEPSGRVLAFNEVASRHMSALTVHAELDGLLESSFDELAGRSDEWIILRTRDGLNVTARIQGPASRGERVSVPMGRRSGQPRAADVDDPFPALHAGDPGFVDLMWRARQVFNRGIPLVLEGETGTGKEWVARRLHDCSERGAGPMISVNCAAIPDSLAEAELFGYRPGAFTGASREGAAGHVQRADGGTLFLDEIGDMPLSIQSRLLRVLQERAVVPIGGTDPIPVNFSLVSATHQNLAQRVEQGAFRADLYYRICGFRVTLPALRNRADLEGLISRMLAVEDPSARIAPAARDCLLRYPWPGNLRELQNALRTALALAKPGWPIEILDLPEPIRASDMAVAGEPSEATGGLREAEERCMRDAVEAHGGNYAAAARALGISRSTLYRRLRRG